MTTPHTHPGVEQSAAASPAHGYSLHEAASGVYMITDENYQNMFATTSDGVVLFDAPPPLLPHFAPAIREVTDDPITTIVYTHIHNDHIGAAGALVTPDTAIYAEAGAAAYLEAKQDPTRPLPTEVFTGATTLTVGGREFLLERQNFHSVAGDVLIRLPREKVVMAIDIIAPDWVPLLDFDGTANMFEYINIFDRILGLDFDTFVGGHSGRLGNRTDLELNRDYTRDVYETVKRVSAEMDFSQLIGIDRPTEQKLAKALFAGAWEQAAQEIIERWKDSPLQGAELWAESHCRAMLIYVRFCD
jgi:glyoxylase-like metal-dependent hydrolase (beta-lactamase superfamily II)